MIFEDGRYPREATCLDTTDERTPASGRRIRVGDRNQCMLIPSTRLRMVMRKLAKENHSEHVLVSTRAERPQRNVRNLQQSTMPNLFADASDTTTINAALLMSVIQSTLSGTKRKKCYDVG